MYNTAVHLADTTFAKIQSCPNFFHCQLFIIVENDNQAFIAVKSFRYQPHQIILLNTAGRILSFFIFKNVDFIMVGGNDLKQFFFAADRENERVRRRYDVLSTSFLSFLALIREKCDQFGIPLSFCGEDAGKPIEALALSAVGFRTLSMQPDCIGPVKALLRNISLSEVSSLITECIEKNVETVRLELTKYLEDVKIPHNKMSQDEKKISLSKSTYFAS